MNTSVVVQRERYRTLKCTPTAAKKLEQVYAGDIAAAIGLKDTTTGDSLIDEKLKLFLSQSKFRTSYPIDG